MNNKNKERNFLKIGLKPVIAFIFYLPDYIVAYQKNLPKYQYEF